MGGSEWDPFRSWSRKQRRGLREEESGSSFARNAEGIRQHPSPAADLLEAVP